ncbi:GLPGLI family protein [Empedobacter sedimenti]|uniref:GLPGLI family protein n=1 Tax=Empedobacter sedimenti TaxID=3042610 RepID=UPI0024A6B7B0|nr:GLPGLI family protein [Empedobacter sedimenti]
MKKVLLFALCFATNLFAQEKFVIEYKQKTEVNEDKVKEIEREQKQNGKGFMKIGSGKDLYHQLEYNGEISNFDRIQTVDNNQANGSAGAFSISIGGETKALIGDQTNKKYTQEVKLDGVNYLVNYPFKDYQWNITDEETTILGHRVIKAISEKENVEAWFAPDMKANVGPAQVNGLPGTVLKAIVQLKSKLETKLIYEAVKINTNPKRFTKLKESTNKVITEAELKVLREESRKKMMSAFGQGVDKN